MSATAGISISHFSAYFCYLHFIMLWNVFGTVESRYFWHLLLVGILICIPTEWQHLKHGVLRNYNKLWTFHLSQDDWGLLLHLYCQLSAWTFLIHLVWATPCLVLASGQLGVCVGCSGVPLPWREEDTLSDQYILTYFRMNKSFSEVNNLRL